MSWKNRYIDLLDNVTNYVIKYDPKLSNLEISERIKEQKNNFNNLYIEVGPGSGRHIIELAKRSPADFFVGLEIRYKRIYKTAEKAVKLDLKNIFLMQWNAQKISECLENDSLAGIYINFPDPWEKRRWQKHRLLQADWLETLIPIMKNGAFISFKSDHLEYFETTKAEILSIKKFTIEELSYDLHSSDYNDTNIKTEFESLFLTKGIKIKYLKAFLKK